MADDADEYADLRRRAQAFRNRISAEIPDTPGHRERMAGLREGRRQLVAMVPIAELRMALDTACAGCGNPDHDRNVDRSAQSVADTIVRVWTLFRADLRTLTRELREGRPSDPIPDDERFAIDETFFRPLDLPDRMSRVQLRNGGGATTWRAYLRKELQPAFATLPANAAISADEIIHGFATNLRAAVDASGGTLHVYGVVITRTERGYDIAHDVPPPPSSAS
ncbi:MAG: hypothetical protein Q7R80_01770 [bacterium]|nr:hypothetical protein [bacterium]